MSCIYGKKIKLLLKKVKTLEESGSQGEGQNYVTVQATSQTTDATDVLPASGQASDTIYRVSNWDGSTNSGAGAFDVTKYSEYAWDDQSNPNKYVFLCVNTAIGEVFDISVYNNNAVYADLAAALGTNGANVPESLRKGGMSVKFIQGSVQSSDNKYVQYRLMLSTFTATQFINTANWQGVDEEPLIGSDNLVKSGGVGIRLERLDNIIAPNNNLLGEDVNEYYPVTIHPGDYFTVSTSDGSVFAPSNLTIYCYDEDKVQRDYFSLGSSNSNSKIIQYNRVTCKYLKLNTKPNVPLMVNYGNQALPYTQYVKPLSEMYETKEDADIIKKNIGGLSANLIGNDTNEYYPVNIEPGAEITVSTSDGEAFNTSGLQILCYDVNKNQTDYYGLGVNDTFRKITYNRTTCRFIKLNKTPRVPLMVTYGNTVKPYEPYLFPIQDRIEKVEQEIDSLDNRVHVLEGTGGENIVGGDWTKMYPVTINGGEKLTISSPDWNSDYDSYGLQLIGYDENKERIANFYYGVGNLPRTITVLITYDVKYLGWNKFLPCRVKVEFGETATDYKEYKGLQEFVFPVGWETAALSAYNACVSKMNDLECDGIPIFIETDIHRNQIMLNPLQWIDNMDNRFKQINLGDNLEFSDEDDWANQFKKEGEQLSNYICIAGNHDVEPTTPHISFKNYVEIERLYTSLSIDYKKPSQRPFFISYDNKYSVKYIVTCPYYNEDYDLENFQPSDNRKFKSAQVEWLIGELSKNDGYDIVMLMHQLVNPTGYKDRNNTSVATPDYPYIGLWQLYKDRRNKRSGTITDSEGVMHSYDFTNCKNDFLCSFQGHWHEELILAEDNTVSYVSTTTGAIDISTGGFTKGACTIALIDRESKHLYIWAFSGDGVKNMLTFNI